MARHVADGRGGDRGGGGHRRGEQQLAVPLIAALREGQ